MLYMIVVVLCVVAVDGVVVRPVSYPCLGFSGQYGGYAEEVWRVVVGAVLRDREVRVEATEQRSAAEVFHMVLAKQDVPDVILGCIPVSHPFLSNVGETADANFSAKYTFTRPYHEGAVGILLRRHTPRLTQMANVAVTFLKHVALLLCIVCTHAHVVYGADVVAVWCALYGRKRDVSLLCTYSRDVGSRLWDSFCTVLFIGQQKVPPGFVAFHRIASGVATLASMLTLVLCLATATSQMIEGERKGTWMRTPYDLKGVDVGVIGQRGFEYAGEIGAKVVSSAYQDSHMVAKESWGVLGDLEDGVVDAVLADVSCLSVHSAQRRSLRESTFLHSVTAHTFSLGFAVHKDVPASIVEAVDTALLKWRGNSLTPKADVIADMHLGSLHAGYPEDAWNDDIDAADTVFIVFAALAGVQVLCVAAGFLCEKDKPSRLRNDRDSTVQTEVISCVAQLSTLAAEGGFSQCEDVKETVASLRKAAACLEGSIGVVPREMNEVWPEAGGGGGGGGVPAKPRQSFCDFADNSTEAAEKEVVDKYQHTPFHDF